MSRAACSLLACVLWLLSGVAAAGADRIQAATGEGHAWVVAEQVWRTDHPAWDLYHTAAESPLGTLSRVMPLRERPAAMIADGPRLLMIYAAISAERDEAVRPVRSISAVVSGVGGVWIYAPSGRARAEPALPGSDVILGTGVSPRGPMVLLRDRSTSGPGRALVLERGEWAEAELPDGIAREREWGLAPIPGGVEFRAGERAWGWVDDAGWRPRREPLAEGASIVAGTQLVSAERGDDGTLSLRLERAGGAVPLAQIEGVPAEHAMAHAGDAVAVYWFDDTETHRLRGTVVSAITGDTLFDGLMGSPSPLEPEDLQLLALIAVSVVLIVVLFLIRPEGDMHAEPLIPEGTALAEPLPRLTAALIDAFPAALISAQVWGVGVTVAFSPAMSLETTDGLGPILTTAAVYFVHTFLTEWFFGRTLGKRVMGLRVVDSRGAAGLRPKQAFIRALFKSAFPPLTMLLLLEPARRHPADQVAGTIVVSRARPAGGEDRPGDGRGGS